ncbi:MAG: UDP-N-acetylglucosamine 1-carboxyvinyltransferase [Candidatus Dormibacteria bacterium]
MTRLLQIDGGHHLEGEVRTAGSKNAALPILVASLLTRAPCHLSNVPHLADVDNTLSILAQIGVRVERDESQVVLEASADPNSEVPEGLARKMRASLLFMGPLLARTGRAVVPKPGGDDIGMRRVDQHVYGLLQLGARVEEDHQSFVCTVEHLRGAEIHLDMPTVTGTENIMMAACLAEGRTTIVNAAREPHVADLAAALQSMGAQITGVGSDRVEIEGVASLSGINHRVTPDYLEAGTYAIAAAAAGGDVHITDAPVADLRGLILKLRHAGVDVEVGETWMRIHRQGDLQPVDLITWTHPGFATDLQPQYTALMTQAAGASVIQEFLFENRFSYVPELVRMGAQIDLASHGRSIRVSGPSRLRAADVAVPDIRSGAALLIGALCAEGRSHLSEIEHLERGYEDMTGKLARLGSRVEEVRGTHDTEGARPPATE